MFLLKTSIWELRNNFETFWLIIYCFQHWKWYQDTVTLDGLCYMTVFHEVQINYEKITKKNILIIITGPTPRHVSNGRTTKGYIFYSYHIQLKTEN